jgi:hypothetical protein
MAESMHVYNELLPECEKSYILEDDQDELKKLLACLDEVESDPSNNIDPIKFGKMLRLLRTRLVLKYQRSDELCDRILNVLYKLMSTKNASIAQRRSLVNMMHSFLKKKPKNLSFSFDWKLFWHEIRAISLRLNRSESVSNPHVTTDFLTVLVEFLHCARYMLPDNVGLEIAHEATELLSDVRNPACYEGLLLLVLCLPTAFQHYDEYLPKWIHIWSNVSHNPVWDCCWLTIFTRARKHARTFDWLSLSPLLLSKGKELIVPVSKQRQSSHLVTVPDYYRRWLILNADPKLIALNKLAKLVYFVTLLEPGNESMLVQGPVITITPSTAASVLKDAAVEFDYSGFAADIKVHKGAVDIAMFFQSIRSCVHPACQGAWTQPIAFFATTLVSEISRHLGRNYAFNLGPGQSGSDKAKFQAPVHMPTIRYCLGFLTVIVMEGVFGRNPTTSLFYTSCLKNLVTIDPTLSTVVIPYLLAALDPAAVSQSHQTPIALQSLWIAIKPLLFPNPLFVRYIPDLLKLLLPGIDANDRIKTNATLSVIITICSHVPVRTDYDSYTNHKHYLETKPYISGVTTTDGGRSVAEIEAWVHTQLVSDKPAFEALGGFWAEWIPSLLAKIFLMLEAEEAKQKGRPNDPISDSIGECVSVFFQSIESPDLMETVISVILKYFATSLPVNSVKTSGRILQYLVARHPALLERVLTQLLDVNTGGLVHASNGTLSLPWFENYHSNLILLPVI